MGSADLGSGRLASGARCGLLNTRIEGDSPRTAGAIPGSAVLLRPLDVHTCSCFTGTSRPLSAGQLRFNIQDQAHGYLVSKPRIGSWRCVGNPGLVHRLRCGGTERGHEMLRIEAASGCIIDPTSGALHVATQLQVGVACSDPGTCADEDTCATGYNSSSRATCAILGMDVSALHLVDLARRDPTRTSLWLVGCASPTLFDDRPTHLPTSFAPRLSRVTLTMLLPRP